MKDQNNKEWEKLCQTIYEEIDRCIIHMETGLFSANRAEALHAKVIQLLPKRITKEDTFSLGLGLGKAGIAILINPDYFLKELKTIEERSAALRHIEQHVFLSHPSRERDFAQLCREQELNFYPNLYQIAADVEANSFIAGYQKLAHSLRADALQEFSIPKAASAETIYHHLLDTWEKDSASLLSFQHQKCPCDQRHWQGEKSFNEQGVLLDTAKIDGYTWELLHKELDRILIVARETLDIGVLKQLPKDLNGKLDSVLSKYDLRYTDPKIAESARKEIDAILVKMMLLDPFFGQFLSGCVRQITDTIETAGVAVLRKYIALMINPTFFMKELKSRAERTAVLKHEALHIMLKHVLQMRNPKFANKRLYNIAADLETNQYIGSPWKLPAGAVLLSSFPDFKLPENDVAETYYKLLQNEADKLHFGAVGEIPEDAKNAKNAKNAKRANRSQQCLADLLGGEGPMGGHSDHDAWGDRVNSDQNNMNSGINSASDAELESHNIDVERQVKQALDSLSAKQAGNVPGHFLKLLNDWIKARQPAIDWKKELRLFVSSNPSTTIKKTYRKKNKRYFNWLQESLKSTSISADAINLLAHKKPELLPQIKWDDIPQEIQVSILKQRPNLDVAGTVVIDWKKMPYFGIFQLQKAFPELSWPAWDNFSEAELKQISLIRVPLDPEKLPIDIIIVIAHHYSYLLPHIDWDVFNPVKQKDIKKAHPYLQQSEFPAWSLLPSEIIIYLHNNNPELFSHLHWNNIPASLVAQLPYFNLGPQPFRIVRKIPRTIPGTKKVKNLPRILVIIDTSGSVSNQDIEYLFAEVDEMHRIGAEVHILEADLKPCLFFKYIGEKPLAGRGGTAFDPALKWVNQARFEGVDTLVKKAGSEPQIENVQKRFDGVIYLTDGEAMAPTEKPYCRLMWVLTPRGTDEAIKSCAYPSSVIKLPSYADR